MPELPSIYSDEGLNRDDSKRFITTRKEQTANGGSMEYKINQLIYDLNLQKPQRQLDEDIVMIGSDDSREVETITALVSTQRLEEQQWEKPISILDNDDTSPFSIPSQKLIFLVIDTNFILSHLDIIDELLKLYQNYKESYQLIIPRTTMQELDGLKNSKQQNNDNELLSNKSISQLARWANDWCYNQLATSNPLVRGQRIDEKLDKTTIKDDSILDCCLYIQDANPNHLVILLSNDKNFCMKLLSNGILTISYRPKMNAKLIIKTIIEENLTRGNNRENEIIDDSMDIEFPDNYLEKQKNLKESQFFINDVNDFHEGVKIIYDEISSLLISLVDKIMQLNYGDDLELISYKRCTNLTNIFTVLIQYWIPVFKEYIIEINLKKQYERKFDKIQLLCELPDSLLRLNEFYQFWVMILNGLYKDKDERDKDALKILIKRWENLIEQITQLG